MYSKWVRSSSYPSTPSDDLHLLMPTCVDMRENMGEYPAGLSLGDLEIVNDDVGELYFAH